MYADAWSEIGGWSGFFGKEPRQERQFFKTVEEAMAEVQRLRIHTVAVYDKRYTESPRLHSNPNMYYAKDWARIGKWRGFFGGTWREHFQTVEEASAEVRRLGIRSRSEYLRRYQESDFLPCNPHLFYADDWDRIGRYAGFFGRPIVPKRVLFASIHEAMQEVRRLGITHVVTYRRRYKESPCLPAAPNRTYARDWDRIGRWSGYLRGEHKRSRDLFPTIAGAMAEARRLGIRTFHEYKRRYAESPRLPAAPDQYYADSWRRIGKWRGFLAASVASSRDAASTISLMIS